MSSPYYLAFHVNMDTETTHPTLFKAGYFILKYGRLILLSPFMFLILIPRNNPSGETSSNSVEEAESHFH